MEGYIAQVIMFSGNFAPRFWAFCQGQILSIAQNTALFSLLGTTYGGNGQTTFALPDLRGRAPIGTGQGPGLPNIVLGQMAGTENVTLTSSQMPMHSHPSTVTAVVSNSNPTTDEPNGSILTTTDENSYASPSAANGTIATKINANVVAINGGGNPFSIRQPYIGMNYVICISGIYPSRN